MTILIMTLLITTLLLKAIVITIDTDDITYECHYF
jgi:hypothetical protein